MKPEFIRLHSLNHGSEILVNKQHIVAVIPSNSGSYIYTMGLVNGKIRTRIETTYFNMSGCFEVTEDYNTISTWLME